MNKKNSIPEKFQNYITSDAFAMHFMFNVFLKKTSSFFTKELTTGIDRVVLLELRWYLNIRIYLLRKKSHGFSPNPVEIHIIKSYGRIFNDNREYLELLSNILDSDITDHNTYLELLTKLKNFIRSKLDEISKKNLSIEVESHIAESLSSEDILLKHFTKNADFCKNLELARKKLNKLFLDRLLVNSEFYLKHLGRSEELKEFYYSLTEKEQENERYSSAIGVNIGFFTKNFEY
jgi:hypothetical protein